MYGDQVRCRKQQQIQTQGGGAFLLTDVFPLPLVAPLRDPQQWQGGFGASFTITNTGTTAISGWHL
ncbi:MAG TPA: cellulose binding domain-containing protein [Ktedonobacteraceae bacterium]|nr:cellulose binding domain-containing protein [Ktedonobacteraceae bacterium]